MGQATDPLHQISNYDHQVKEFSGVAGFSDSMAFANVKLYT
jgi:hypothetical protein